MTVHHLSDEGVHTTWTAAHRPRVTVRSGDEVTFRTRDGFDGQLDGLPEDALNSDLDKLDFGRIAPLSGPVAVEGARPGDAVRIEILELEPSGPGWTVVWPAWAGFDFHRPAGVPAEGRIRTFAPQELRPGRALAIAGAAVPVRPMLGMVGVAPAHGRLPTLPPREFGGNMDLREVTVGSTVRLPVFVPEALVSVGDGHAAQGDGELCTTAVECAMSGRVRITLEPDRGPRQPEVETPDSWIVTGYGRSLDDAVRSAIDAMHAKLVEIGLDPTDAYMLLSLAGHLAVNQVANIPHVGARVTIKKEVLHL